MIRGLRTAIYHVEDLKKASEWYSKVLGIKPYFSEPFYVGFNVGGFELGLDPDMSGIVRGNNVGVYWGVDNIAESLKQLIAHGAKENSAVQDVGGGVLLATLLDPFGNVFGIIENPHFKFSEGKK